MQFKRYIGWTGKHQHVHKKGKTTHLTTNHLVIQEVTTTTTTNV